ncbi:MAG: metallophosphoesterase [Gracilibacteraceae bacterium]|jgi:3',5'-cyclic AMP phosphodiesterase CpdA|nr:metallophosphoesterase [Gracilibacteraceae bacterium]
MNFIHMSDPHIRVTPLPPPASDFPAEKIVDDGRRLRAALRRAKSHSPSPDFFVFSGDLVHEGEAADYAYLRSLLDEELAGTPYFTALGNHDRHAAFWEGFWGRRGADAPYFACALLNGLRVITLDTSPTDGCTRGALSDEQLDFLRTTLKTPAPLGSILVMHHPVSVCGGAYDHILLQDRYGLSRMIQGGDIRAVLTGHAHFTRFGAVSGVLCATAAGTAFCIDPTDAERMVFLSASSYLYGHLSAQEIIMGAVDMELDKTRLFSRGIRVES